ncbi:MAG: EMC3/TMCO1 family protein [Nanoarchaeota archaeon]
MVFESILNAAFGFVLPWPAWLSILIISFILTLITTLVYKYTTNQSEMKRLKDETKMHQKKLKELKGDPKKAMEVQQKAMAVNMEYMKHSFKPMLYTMLPLLLIFGWLSAHYAYEPLLPNVPFNVSVYTQGLEGKEISLESIPELTVSEAKKTIQGEQATWTLQGSKGDYKLTVTQETHTAERRVLISNERNYENPLGVIKNGPIQKFITHNKELEPFGSFSLFGWHPGWIGVYIIFSIALSTLMRKLMNVY